jgi:alpha-galactosidase
MSEKTIQPAPELDEHGRLGRSGGMPMHVARAIALMVVVLALVAGVGRAAGSTTSHQSYRGDGTMVTLTEALRRVAPDALVPHIVDGPGFDVQQNGASLIWRLRGSEQLGDDRWAFLYETSTGLEAAVMLELMPEAGAAVYTTALTNASDKPSDPIDELWAYSLHLTGGGSSRVISAAGGPLAHEYPPKNVFWTQLRDIDDSSPRAEFSEPASWSSNTHLPIFMVLLDATPDSTGLLFGLGWSAAWRALVQFDDSDKTLHLAEGPTVHRLVLEPNERLELPPVHLVFFDGGFEKGSNACRRYIREHVTPDAPDGLILPPLAYTIWPGIVAPYTETDVYPQIDAAAYMGVEVFIIDDAWYPGDFPKGRGNWYPDPAKWPSGFDKVAEYVKSRGMGLGLFFEPGVAMVGTQLLNEHPEFFYSYADAAGTRVYRFSDAAARAHILELVSGFVERYDLRYIRWDHNLDAIPFIRDEDPTLKLVFAHVRGLYDVWETLLDRHPRLALESCAAGGRRLDLGSMQRSHACWCNDNMGNPHIYHVIQAGGNVFVPGYYLGASLGWRPNMGQHPDASLSDLSFLSRMAGEFFFQGRLSDWPEEKRERARHWADVYKRQRHLLGQEYYRLLPQPESEADWNAFQFCDGSAEGLVFAFRVAGETDTQRLRLRRLDGAKSYTFTDEGVGTTTEHAGNDLIERGLAVFLAPNDARLYSYRDSSYQ